MTEIKVFMDARKVIEILEKIDEQQISRDDLLEQLTETDLVFPWDLDRLNHVLEYSAKNEGRYAGLSLTQGGAVIRLSSNERVGLNTGAYRDIVEAINGQASNLAKIFSARNPSPYDVHVMGRQAGHWSRPDLLVEFRGRRLAPRPTEIHSIEFEFPGHAWPENVAQAYVSGRGSHKSWLLFSLDDYLETQDKRAVDPNWSATEALARDLGVGLIGYCKLSAASTWRRILKARRRSPDRTKEAFIKDLLAQAKSNSIQ